MIGRALNKFFKRQSLYRLAFPPGHYASPIPNVEEALRTVRNEFNEEILDIDLNRENQLKLFKSLIPFIREIPFTNHQNNKSRYYFSNPMFQHMDGAILYGLAKYFNSYIFSEYGSLINDELPNLDIQHGGGSLWLVKK